MIVIKVLLLHKVLDMQNIPQNYVKLTEEKDIRNMERLIEYLEEDDDVQNVWHNWQQD